jgi:hypothetical protein
VKEAMFYKLYHKRESYTRNTAHDDTWKTKIARYSIYNTQFHHRYNGLIFKYTWDLHETYITDSDV